MPHSIGKPVNVFNTRTALNFLILKEGTTQSDIRKAYRKAALVTHPDKPGGKKEVFIKVNECYEWLMEHGSILPKPRPVPVCTVMMWRGFTSTSAGTTADTGWCI